MTPRLRLAAPTHPSHPEGPPHLPPRADASAAATVRHPRAPRSRTTAPSQGLGHSSLLERLVSCA